MQNSGGDINYVENTNQFEQESQIETAAGIVFNKKIGDVVSSGDIIAYIHTNDETKIMGAIRNLEDAFKITNKKVNITSRVVEIL